MRALFKTAAQIAEGIEREAAKINDYYQNKNATPGADDSPVLALCVLKGAAFFFADLLRKLNFPLEIDFIRIASYGNARTSSGSVRLTQDVETRIAGRRVLVVEDVVETGRSLATLRERFLKLGAADVRIVVLVEKKVRRAVDVPIDFRVFESDERYLVGCGFDDAEAERNLPDIWLIESD